MNLDSKIFVAGHKGLVGSSIVRSLKNNGYANLIFASKKDLDLRNDSMTLDFFHSIQPEYVFLAAAKCGGIKDNINNPVQFLEDNLRIQNSVISSSYKVGVKKLLFLGTACIYPKECVQPIKEEYLLSGFLEPTNEAYSIAKIAGIKLCQAYNKQYKTNFISAQPSNVYGPNDNFNPESSHVIAGLIRRLHEAKQSNQKSIDCWGTGNVRREFIYVDDLAEALIFLMHHYDGNEIINVGTGEDVSIKELVKHLVSVIEYHGEINWDQTKPEGMKQRLLDVKKLINLGWQPKTLLNQGLRLTYDYFKKEER
jgi:GDP-L-fucose synthase